MSLRNDLLIAFTLIAILITASTFVLTETDDELALPKIVAIGDMHGDYSAYEEILIDAKLMDAKGDWIGGDTIFIQTGDIPDRGPDTHRIIESLQKLEQQAPEVGGKVVPMIGNHEAMNVVRDLRYVHPGEYAAFVDENSLNVRSTYFADHHAAIIEKASLENPNLTLEEIRVEWEANTPLGKIEHAVAWSVDGEFGGWVARNQIVAKVGPYLFAHGGYSREFSKYSLIELNDAGQRALRERNWGHNSILRHELGPLWYRGNVRGREDHPDFSREAELTHVLETYDATHLVVGHTRNEDGIRVSLNGRLLQIDTGASAHYGGVKAFLRIEKGRFFAHEEGAIRELVVAGS